MPDQAPLLLTVKQASEILGVNTRTVYRWLASGLVNAIPVDPNPTYRVHVLSLDTLARIARYRDGRQPKRRCRRQAYETTEQFLARCAKRHYLPTLRQKRGHEPKAGARGGGLARAADPG